MTTVLIEQQEIAVVPVETGSGLWLSAADTERVTGFTLKPEGMCRDAICVPVPRGAASFVQDGAVEAAALDDTWVPAIRYAYRVNGREFSSDRVRFGIVGQALSDAQAFVYRYPRGTTVAVSYDPQNPAEAILEHSVAEGHGLFITGAIAAVISGAALIWLLVL